MCSHHGSVEHLRLSARDDLSVLGAPVEIRPRRTPKAEKTKYPSIEAQPEVTQLIPGWQSTSYSEGHLRDACSVSFDPLKPLP